MVRTMVATPGRNSFGIRVSTLAMKWVLQRCQPAPANTVAMACFSPPAFAGVRRGELLALTWDNVDLDKREIHIERSLGRRSTGLVVDPPKTERGRRTIKLPAVAADVLSTHQQRQANHKEQYQEIYNDHNLVFADEFGQFINPMSLKRAVNTLGERVGHPNMRNHDLRHFHISQSLELGVPIAETSARAGHSDPSITWRVYAHLLPGAEPATPGVIDDAMAAFRLDAGSETPEDDRPRDC